MIMFRKFSATHLAVLVGLGIVRAAAAEQSTASASPSASDDNGLQEIVVTAQKRVEYISDVGLSIQSFTGEALAKLGVSDTSDLDQIVPAFNFSRSSANTPIYTVRGIGFNTPNLSSTSPVGIYVDQVSYAYPYMSN